MRELELQKFIKANDNWKDLLRNPPYNISVRENNKLILLKYSQINSDFTLPIVRECRGIIVDNSGKVVCYPFDKFFNLHEPFADEIDWESAKVQEKLDGSIIKLFFYEDEWRLATNGTIDAYQAYLTLDEELLNTLPYKTYGELFDVAKHIQGLDYNILDKKYTYIFELVSPYTRVVVPYATTKIYHIGTRNNITFEELTIDIGIEHPQEYYFKDARDCIKMCASLMDDKEGYVVVDKYYKRVKIKNPKYVIYHAIKNNGVITPKSFINYIRENEIMELLCYFPEFKVEIDKYKRCIEDFINYLRKETSILRNMTFDTQKDFALYIKDKIGSGYFFSWKKNNALDPYTWLWSMSDGNIVDMLEAFTKSKEKNLIQIE